MPAIIEQNVKEKIIAEYAISNSLNSVAKKYNVSWATARKIVNEAESQINALREEKQKKYINDAWEVVNVYLAKLMDPKTVKEAKARDCGTVIIGMLERIQKQQEINQQYDLLYNNISEMVKQSFIDESSKDEALYKEITRYVTDYWEKKNAIDKEIIRDRIKKGKYVSIKEYDDGKERLSQLYDEVKTEILEDLFKNED